MTTNNQQDNPEPEPEAPKEVWEECDGICVNPKTNESCDYLPCFAILDDWGRLQYILDCIDDINEKIGFLQTLTSRNSHVCYDGRCPIFTDIMNLRRLMADYDLPITSEKQINQLNLSNQQKKVYQAKYDKAKFECDKALQQIMTVATTNKAKESKEETFHRRRIELIEKLNQSNFPIPMEVKSDIEKQLNTVDGKLQWDSKTKKKKKKKTGEKDSKD